MIDYWLPADANGTMTLEISTRTGVLVRRYSSADAPAPYDEKAFNVPMYWARPPRALSASKGMHRFVWDLRYPPPGAVQRDFPISAIPHDTPLEPLGVLAVPDVYTVKLAVNGAALTERLTLKMDPRARITPIGLARQLALATKIADLMNRTYAAIRNPQSAINPQSPNPQSTINPQSAARNPQLEALHNDLATAYEAVEGADRAPTVQAAKTVVALEERARRLLSSSVR